MINNGNNQLSYKGTSTIYASWKNKYTLQSGKYVYTGTDGIYKRDGSSMEDLYQNTANAGLFTKIDRTTPVITQYDIVHNTSILTKRTMVLLMENIIFHLKMSPRRTYQVLVLSEHH